MCAARIREETLGTRRDRKPALSLRFPGSPVLGACVRDHFTQAVNVSQHLIEMLSGSFKLRWVALLLEELHGVLEGVQLFQQFRDRTAEVLGFGSSSRH